MPFITKAVVKFRLTIDLQSFEVSLNKTFKSETSQKNNTGKLPLMASEFKSAFKAHFGIVNKMGKEKVIIAKKRQRPTYPCLHHGSAQPSRPQSSHYGKHRNMVPYINFEHLL